MSDSKVKSRKQSQTKSGYNPLVWIRRVGKYSYYRILRYPGSPYSIAAGFAAGAAVSFTPLLGAHFILGAILAWVIRGNIVTSAIGTIVGNPWTFPFIFYWSYSFGAWLTGADKVHITFEQIIDISFLKGNFVTIMLPMLIGGVISGIIAWFLFFGVIYTMIIRWRARRKNKKIEAQA